MGEGCDLLSVASVLKQLQNIKMDQTLRGFRSLIPLNWIMSSTLVFVLG